MKREPTEVVALCLHALTAIVSVNIWLRADKLREGEFRDFGGALPALTELLYDFHLPEALFVGLIASFVAALAQRGKATVIISAISLGGALLVMGALWWALRLPFLPL